MSILGKRGWGSKLFQSTVVLVYKGILFNVERDDSFGDSQGLELSCTTTYLFIFAMLQGFTCGLFCFVLLCSIVLSGGFSQKPNIKPCHSFVR